MENKRCKQILMIMLLTFTAIYNPSLVVAKETETYIVQLSSPPDHIFSSNEDLESWYNTFLPTTTTDSDEKPQMVYAYHRVLKGFAAKLTAEHASAIQKLNGVILARPERVLSLHTTHTPNFLGLHQNLGFWRDSNYGKGIIIGVFDTGITPNHPSFDDAGIGPPPAKWKGKCEVAGCNNKLIGVRSFIIGGTGSLLDEGGHGTHTSSTAAGNFVEGANVLGNVKGTAVGMAPLAHLAMYKVCSERSCGESDMLAAMDAAIEDGVDVFSLSIGSRLSHPFYNDMIAVGAFAAIQNGIFVSCSAGNEGPLKESLSNVAPWILTVGASTIDRMVTATVKLGNGVLLDGQSLFQPKDFQEAFLPLVNPGMSGDLNARFCAPRSLNNIDVKGKVVICLIGGIERTTKGQTVKDAGGAAMILINTQTHGATTKTDVHVLPVSHINYKDGVTILEYLRSSQSPVAMIIFHGTVIGDKSAPQVADFSSRGPNIQSPGILKPDIIGPGVNILAAWPTSVDNTTTAAPFNVISGTSMSCPHLSGIAALLKSSHPDWTPAGIKSAIMTTADLINLNKEPIQDERVLPASLFAVGAGHVNPSKANDPGLIYDIQADDYIPYLCGLGYSNMQVTFIVHNQVSCSNIFSIDEAQLNYPSFAITLSGNVAKSYTRTVTNVGDANSSYTVKIIAAPGVSVTVSPSTLIFSAIKQKLSYQVTFIPVGSGPNQFVEGALEWNSIKHSVRSPISIKYV